MMNLRHVRLSVTGTGRGLTAPVAWARYIGPATPFAADIPGMIRRWIGVRLELRRSTECGGSDSDHNSLRWAGLVQEALKTISLPTGSLANLNENSPLPTDRCLACRTAHTTANGRRGKPKNRMLPCP
jgi:hypothetical protein